MSITVALNTAVSGLLANQQAIGATSENIANVNSPNFVRREVSFFTDAIPKTSVGKFDKKVLRARLAAE